MTDQLNDIIPEEEALAMWRGNKGRIGAIDEQLDILQAKKTTAILRGEKTVSFKDRIFELRRERQKYEHEIKLLESLLDYYGNTDRIEQPKEVPVSTT